MRTPNGAKASEHFQYARRMIFWGFILVPLAPYLVAVGVSFLFLLNSLVASSHSTISRVASDHAENVEFFLDERLNDLDFMLRSFSVKELSQPEKLQELLQHLQIETGAYVDLGLVDATGRHIAYAGPYNLEEKDYTDSPWLLSTIANGVHVSDVFLGHRGIPHFVVAVAKQGAPSVVLRATIDSETFCTMVESIRIGKTGQGHIVNSDGLFQTYADNGMRLLHKDPDFQLYPYPFNNDKAFTTKDHSGKRRLYSIASINEGKWLLVVSQEVAEAFEQLYQAGWYLSAVTMLGGLVIVSLARTFSRRIGSALTEADEVKEHLRDRLSRSVRLAELGEMTASFAHEINNPLQIMESEIAVMRMNLEDLVRIAPPEGEELRAELEDNMSQLQLQIGRCSEVTRSILWFGRQDHVQDAIIHLHELMRAVAAMVKKKAELQDITFHIAEAPGTPAIKGDSGKLQQIFLNLLNNAIYAIVERHGHNGGLLEFTAAPRGKGWVEIQVRDNGTGMPKHVLDNIYTPFFTTKPPRKGTGLGLAVCFGLIKSMGGAIEVETKENQGTAFTILLPAS